MLPRSKPALRRRLVRRALPVLLPAVAAIALHVMAAGSQEPASPGLTPADLAGTWAGAVEHDGESTRVALRLEPGEDGRFMSPRRRSGVQPSRSMGMRLPTIAR